MNTYFLTGQEYDIQYQGYHDDLKFYLSLAKKAHKILELGCGTGRILLPILKAGKDIEGLDGSKSLLRQLLYKAQKMGLKPKTFFANMVNFNLKKKYDLIIIPFRAFLHVLSVGDQKKTLKNISKHLTPKGKMVLNFFNPDFKRMANAGQKEFHSYVKNPLTKNKIKISAINHFYPANQLIKVKFIHEELDKHNLLLKKKDYKLSLRYIFRYEFENLLELTGFKVLKLYGDFKRGKFTDKSREMVWICQKM